MQLLVDNKDLITNMKNIWGDWTGDIKFSDVENKILEKNDFDYDFKGKTCAIVANSSILLDSEYGDFIDSHDYVSRMNLARVEGFEKYVGSKRSFRFLAVKSFGSIDLPRFSAYDINYLPSLKDEHFIIKNLNNWGASSRGTVRHLDNNNKISYFSNEFQKECTSMVKSEPTVGFMTLMFFLNHFEKINVFGFNWYAKGKNHHYYEEVDGDYLGYAHPIELEKSIFKQAEKQGRIKIYE